MYGVLKRLDSSVHFDFHLLSAKGAAREHIFPVGIIMLGSMQGNLLSPCHGVDSPPRHCLYCMPSLGYAFRLFLIFSR
jgi:hypothetical protein